jgi:hypothetical protein
VRSIPLDRCQGESTGSYAALILSEPLDLRSAHASATREALGGRTLAAPRQRRPQADAACGMQSRVSGVRPDHVGPVGSWGAMAVRADMDETKGRQITLRGSIPLTQLASRAASLPKDQESIFSCA